MLENNEMKMDEIMQKPDGNLLNIGKIEIPEIEAVAEPMEIETVSPKAESDKPAAPATKPAKKEKTDPRKIVSIVGIVCGAIILIMGLASMASTPYDGTATVAAKSTTYTGYEFYGGDAYSGMQQASADASNNAAAAADNVALANSYLIELSNLMSKLVGYLLIAFGLMTICGSAYGLATVKARARENINNKE